jgi:prepilin-type N-terminal cleavage/methylation domain-containing protein
MPVRVGGRWGSAGLLARHRQARRQVSGGFTLIELLVVIAVIAILMSLILPSIGSTREVARRTKCLVNLKQIGVAFQLYLSTEGKNQYLPGSTLDRAASTDKDPYWTQALANYYDAAQPQQDASGGGAWVVADGWKCPSDRGYPPSKRDGASKPEDLWPAWQSTSTSYSYKGGEYMLGAFLALMKPTQTVQFAVSKLYEERPNLALVVDSDDWHNPRFAKNRNADGDSSGGSSTEDWERRKWDRNALFFRDWRAEKAPFVSRNDLAEIISTVARYTGYARP